MATILETKNAHAAAAEAYAKAARAYMAAYVELHAYDLAIGNRYGDGVPRTFGEQPVVLAHPVALPDVAFINRDPGGLAKDRHEEIVDDLDD